jgi:hypothetical protein
MRFNGVNECSGGASQETTCLGRRRRRRGIDLAVAWRRGKCSCSHPLFLPTMQSYQQKHTLVELANASGAAAVEQTKKSNNGGSGGGVVFKPAIKTETIVYYHRVNGSSSCHFLSVFVHSSNEPQNSIAMDCAVGAKNLPK